MIQSKNARLTIMKKILILLLSCLLVLCLPLSALAAEGQVLASRQISDEELAILYDTALYKESLEGVTLTDQPIVKIYAGIPYELAGTPFSDLRAQYEAKESVQREYLIGGIHVFTYTENGVTTVGKRGYGSASYVPPYVLDIPRMDTTMNLRGTECTVLDIYCFDESDPYRREAAVYLITDKGTYVLFYADPCYAEPAVFTEEEFAEYAAGLIRYEEATYVPMADGCGMPFLSYVLNIYGTKYDKGVKKDLTPVIGIAAAGGALLIGAAAIALIAYRKKQKKGDAQ